MLEFDPKEHIYRFNGIIVPNVTTILKKLKFIDFGNVSDTTLERARILGGYVHEATALDDKDDLDFNSLSPGLKPYVEAWRKFKEDFKIRFKSEQIEKPLYSKIYRFSGTPDREAIEINGKMTLVDIKTSTTMQRYFELTTAAYKILQEENLGIKIVQRWGIQLLPDGTYKIHPYKNNSDETVFLSCLNIYKWLER